VRQLTDAPACQRKFLLAEPIFDCRIWQRGAKWHWQVISDEHVLACGVAESHRAARNAVVLQSLSNALGNHSAPNKMN